MNRHWYRASLLLVLILGIVSGCAGKAPEGEVNNKAPESAALKEAKESKNYPRLDIYIPITEQWASSRHATSAKTPITTGHASDACFGCHSADSAYYSGQKPSMNQMKNGVTCIMCHKLNSGGFVLNDSDRVRICTKCHTAGNKILPGKEAHHSQAQVYFGEGAIGIPEQPNPKQQKGLACSDCHMPNQNHDFRVFTPSMAEKENRGTICLMCHKNEEREEFSRKVEELQKNTEEKTKKLSADLEAINKKLDSAANLTNLQQLRNEYNIAYTNASIVQADKSKGIHNPKYIKAILDDTEKRVSSLKKSLKI